MKSDQYLLHARIEERHWWFLGRRTILRRLVERVALPSPTVVDVGCGTGANIAALAGAYSCAGIDPSAEAIELAQERFSGQATEAGVRFLCGSVPDDLDEPLRNADLFLLMDVLEHEADDFAYFSKLWAAIRPGAHLLVTVPADPSLWSAHDTAFGHYRRYDRARLARLWEGLPATTRLLSYFNARLFPLVKAVRAVNRWRGRTRGEAGTDFRIPAWPINRALERLFAGEAERLLGAVDGAPQAGYGRGVSLVAILRREPGEVALRSKPADLRSELGWAKPTTDRASTNVTR